MTYYESYKALKTAEAIKEKAISDTKVAMFLGGNADRIKAIEDAMNKAISEIGRMVKHERCNGKTN